MAVEVARLGRKRFENVGAVDGPEVEGSVRPRSLVLSMQPVDSCSSDDRACDHCQSQCDRSIHGVFCHLRAHMQLTSRTADRRCRLINTAGRPSQRGQADWGFRLQGARNKVLTLHAVPNVCFSYELRRSGEADAGRTYDAALLHHRLHFLGVQPSTGLRYVGDILKERRSGRCWPSASGFLQVRSPRRNVLSARVPSIEYPTPMVVARWELRQKCELGTQTRRCQALSAQARSSNTS